MRGAIASMLLIGAATVGVAISTGSAGAGVDGIQCEGENENGGPIVVPTQNGRAQSCAQLEVTKIVTGTPAPAPPPGTTFAVVVDCVPEERDGMIPIPEDEITAQQLPPGQSPPFTTTLTFPEGGGTESVFITGPSDCTVSESPPPGCTLTSIDPVTTEIEEPILYPVTVTNNCDPAVEAAAAVVEVPRFTG
jgi:Domain of unknown function (DUF5979)